MTAPMEETSSGAGSAARDLFLVSFLGLFLEIAMIRWLPAGVRVLSYYTNYVLISCFLGMGLGCTATARADTFRWLPYGLSGFVLLLVGVKTQNWPPVLAWAVLGVLGLAGIAIVFWLSPRRRQLAIVLAAAAVVLAVLSREGVRDLWRGTFVWETGEDRGLKLAVVPFVLVANCLLFVPIGQRMGALFGVLPPIRAYIVNIAGSLAGVAGFSLLSWLWSPPTAWFAVAFAMIPLLLKSRRIPASLALAAGLVAIHVNASEAMWSPYYKIVRTPTGGENYSLTINNIFLLATLDLRDPKTDEMRGWREYYATPYILHKPGRVLVLGAGTGNDVAMALESGATHVDAVEIDPAILKLGKATHPMRPYNDPRVRCVADDARSFMRSAPAASYDLIVYGLVDSGTLLSSRSSVRLENFLYTRESIQEALRLLVPDGVAVLSYLVARTWVGDKLFDLIRDAEGRDPTVITRPGRAEISFAFGPGLTARSGRRPTDEPVDLPTDDWPYLHLQTRGIGNHYLRTLTLMLVAAAALIMTCLPRHGAFDGHFFFLGAGFMLVEARAITAFSLLFGSTWIVNSVVIGAILTMILVANAWVIRARPRALLPYYVALAASLALNFAVSPASLFFPSLALRIAVSGLLVSLPLLFAGVIFAATFARSDRPAADFGINLLGAVAGGALEYLSMSFGFRALVPIALALYAASYFFARKRFGAATALAA